MRKIIVEGKSIREWAKVLGKTYGTLRARAYTLGISVTEYIKRRDTLIQPNRKPFEYEGKTVREWAKEFGITYGSLRARASYYGITVKEFLEQRSIYIKGVGENLNKHVALKKTQVPVENPTDEEEEETNWNITKPKAFPESLPKDAPKVADKVIAALRARPSWVKLQYRPTSLNDAAIKTLLDNKPT